jgi:hypothetical protein
MILSRLGDSITRLISQARNLVSQILGGNKIEDLTTYVKAETFCSQLQVNSKIWIGFDPGSLKAQAYRVHQKAQVTIPVDNVELIAAIGPTVTQVTVRFDDPDPAKQYIKDFSSYNLTDSLLQVTTKKPR